ncbi:MAG: heme o synthase [Bryobacteraceae bacterium]|jgi:protoheme IX farnesyltransferase
MATLAQQPCAVRTNTAAGYWALTKPEINFLIAIATFTGFYLGSPKLSSFSFLPLIHTLLGTVLVASGASALNQYVERCFDAQMRRTRRRPLASGNLEPSSALWFGILLSSAGSLYLAVAVNTLTSVLAMITLASYLMLYTPLKRRTPWCTFIGALPGAMPPLIGWAAASGRLSFEAWVLYAMLFLWQFPHFMAIAWMYREDYARAGYLVLPTGEQSGRVMSWQATAASLTLLPVSLIPALIGGAGLLYLAAACILGSGFFYYSLTLAFRRSNAAARRLLTASIIYLPLLFFLLVLDSRR